MLQGLDPNEALDDIYFWDRLGDLPIPLEYRLALIEYLAGALNGQGPFTLLANFQEYLEQLQAAYELYMMIDEAIEETEANIDEAIDNLEEMIDELFGTENEEEDTNGGN